MLHDEMRERSKAVAVAYGAKAIPTKVIIDKNGIIRYHTTGGSIDAKKIVEDMSAKIDAVKKR
ncbi:hypothetical protein D3C86_1821520 [compost metagenome]